MSARTITIMRCWHSRTEVLRIFGWLLAPRVWRKLRKAMGSYDAAIMRRGVRAIVRAVPQWSAPTDCARVPIRLCLDIKSLCTAVEDVLPTWRKTSEELWSIADALAIGYWSAGEGNREEWVQGANGLWSPQDDEGSDESADPPEATR